ncbi:hypothetical protein ADIWIN_0125 [Winogradskyella psychrotolerans RS-3]|uniref:Glycosyl transferase family 1 domain-containing protein n=1 Tax=Winogradskyella psychrotolerans RS-3 TaxID=641526 RepID=S7VXC3_9FLAO|nr:glycosyltransferase [Winogradskyella psychrotolerans]EPR74761.1 hypothetical protein ADIWIN_0125 [Winogradskyella psychrotolerans RS-3]
MTYVFWQNIISIHQSAFLKALAEKSKVILVVEHELSNVRKTSGWKVPDIGDVELHIAPSENKIKGLLEKNKLAYHLFSGLHAYGLPTKALQFGVELNCSNLAIVTESFKTSGIKGLLRRIKYLGLSLKYKTKIKAIFVTGLPARRCFENLFFDSRIIFDWGYFTESINEDNFENEKLNLPNLLFVGSLDDRKNILPFLPIILRHNSNFNKFYIVGSGPLKFDLLQQISEKTSVEYIEVLENTEIQKLMLECDLLLLPSIFDGWGAVVNEALGNGMRVLCSSSCGASILLDYENRGGVFHIDDEDFESHLVKWLKKGRLSELERKSISDWSKNHISGSVAASYFNNCIDFLNNNAQHKPKAPWL